MGVAQKLKDALSCHRGKGLDSGRKQDEFSTMQFDRSYAYWARDSRLVLGQGPVVYNGIQYS